MKRHAPDWTSFVAGLTFLGVALTYLAGDAAAHRVVELRWVAPILFIGLGLAGLAGTLAKSRRKYRDQSDSWE